MSVLPARHAVTVDEFGRMVDAGVFAADRRLELIDGEILDMSPIGSPHQACVDRLTRLFAPLAVSGQALLRVQGSVQVNDLSQPQPDVALLRPRDDFYAGRHPGPDAVFLVVEVADTSLRFDRQVKLPMYAQAGVAEAWVIDLNGGVVDVATRPSSQGYDSVVQAARGDVLSPVAFPDLTVAVTQILG
jgi:Uma2 family endonuclease